jgi:hypothetical protein
MKLPWELFVEARDEAYLYFDGNIRKLARSSSGEIDPSAVGLVDNEVDAFRHAYVSGVFTLEYGSKTAEVLGRLYEFAYPSGSSRPLGGGDARSMDLWNNAVGRRIGENAESREELGTEVHRALEEGALIIDPMDVRRYEELTHDPRNHSKPVIVLRQTDRETPTSTTNPRQWGRR